MRSRSVTLAVSVSVVSAAAAVGCYLRSADLRSDAQWYLERGNAEAQEYANTFDPSIVEKQLQTFESRRAILDEALLWQRGQMLLVLIAVVGSFSSYLLYLFHRLRADLEDASTPSVGEEQRAADRPHSRTA